MRATKKRKMFAIYATPITESINGLEAFSIHYKEYQYVLNEECRYVSSTLSV
jgi:hypothetical protein